MITTDWHSSVDRLGWLWLAPVVNEIWERGLTRPSVRGSLIALALVLAGGQTSVLLTDKQRHEPEEKRFIAAEGVNSIVGHVPVYVDRGKTNELLALVSIGARENGKGYSGDDLKGLAELGARSGWRSKPSSSARRRSEAGLTGCRQRLVPGDHRRRVGRPSACIGVRDSA